MVPPTGRVSDQMLVAGYLRHRDRLEAVLVYNGWFLVIAVFF
jgi:hypothetical protein